MSSSFSGKYLLKILQQLKLFTHEHQSRLDFKVFILFKLAIYGTSLKNFCMYLYLEFLYKITTIYG